jgi:aspartate kinase
MKFGGTSVGDTDRIKAIAVHVAAAVATGDQIAVVVSAMAGQTDDLVGLTRTASVAPDAREQDAVVASGEQVSAALLALALQDAGVTARSWLGWQLPIRTDGQHGRARIEHIDTGEIEAGLKRGEVAVVAGFQGVGPGCRVTTLGRGGSDLTAVALAAALKADRCDIHTDVSGVFTADPRIVARARRLDKVAFEEMMEVASSGAKVLQLRSVEIALNYGVRLRVLSSFGDDSGTLIVAEDEVVEKRVVSAIASSRDEARITLLGLADGVAAAARVFGPLAAANINVDMIVQNLAADGQAANVTFTVPRSELASALTILEAAKPEINYRSLVHDSAIAKVSAIGVGMRSHAGVAQQMFAALTDKGIGIEAISTSEIKISVLIPEEHTELAVLTLHTAYGLDVED